ncbi:MAG: sugar transferase [Myxococcales bacterium]|nr:sugar transferase [Myxococcales bacterium]
MTASRDGRRLFDLAVGALAAPLVLAVLPVVAALIVADDGPPVFFVHERLGRGRRPFRLVKLRTMRAGRVTRLGRWLRATGIDELPQFLHVLSGKMAVVGPRPITAADAERLGWQGPDFDARFGVRPGVTGPVQVAGAISGAVSARLEREYVATRSLGRDLGYVVLTLGMLVVGKRRVQRWLETRS